MRSMRRLSVWCAGLATVFAILGTWYATWIAGLVDQANAGQRPWQPLMVPGIVGLVVIPLVWICILFIIVGWPAAAILTIILQIRRARWHKQHDLQWNPSVGDWVDPKPCATESEVDAGITRLLHAERESRRKSSTFFR